MRWPGNEGQILLPPRHPYFLLFLYHIVNSLWFSLLFSRCCLFFLSLCLPRKSERKNNPLWNSNWERKKEKLLLRKPCCSLQHFNVDAFWGITKATGKSFVTQSIFAIYLFFFLFRFSIFFSQDFAVRGLGDHSVNFGFLRSNSSSRCFTLK